MDLAKLKKLFLDLLDTFGLAYWVKIITISPICTYYLGSFATKREAKLSLTFYLNYLRQDKSEVVSVEIRKLNPRKLANFDYYQDMSFLFQPIAASKHTKKLRNCQGRV